MCHWCAPEPEPAEPDHPETPFEQQLEADGFLYDIQEQPR